MSSSTSSEIVVRARHLGKAYQLYARRNDWLKQVMFGWWKSYFKPFWVLRDIDLDVHRGESIGILGRNGCGKSTLLQVICGMTLPSNGELRVTGRIAPVLALGSTFDLELSGRENVMIGGAVLGLKRAEVLRKFDSIAEFAGIGDYMEQPVKHYSMGMRTRLAFAICAHVEAEILVVDEALAVGDAAFQRKCLDWIDSFRKNGTLLFVSHSMAEVRRLCTPRHLDRGRPDPRSRASPARSSAPTIARWRWRRTTSTASRRASDGRWTPAPCSGSGSAGGRSATLVQWASAALARRRRPAPAPRRTTADFSIVAPLAGAGDASEAYVGSLAELSRAGAEVLICVASERDEAVARVRAQWPDAPILVGSDDTFNPKLNNVRKGSKRRAAPWWRCATPASRSPRASSPRPRRNCRTKSGSCWRSRPASSRKISRPKWSAPTSTAIRRAS